MTCAGSEAPDSGQDCLGSLPLSLSGTSAEKCGCWRSVADGAWRGRAARRGAVGVSLLRLRPKAPGSVSTKRRGQRPPRCRFSADDSGEPPEAVGSRRGSPPGHKRICRLVDRSTPAAGRTEGWGFEPSRVRIYKPLTRQYVARGLFVLPGRRPRNRRFSGLCGKYVEKRGPPSARNPTDHRSHQGIHPIRRY